MANRRSNNGGEAGSAEKRVVPKPSLSHGPTVESQPPRNDSPPDCVHDRVAGWAARQPTSIAIFADETEVPYGELEARANQLAHALRALGARADVCVGVCFEQSPELIVALLAVLKAGGCYLPLDLRLPAERLRFMINDAKVSIVVSLRPTLPRELVPDYVKTVFLESDAAWIASHPTASVSVQTDPNGLACVIYTSGSTGRPKGVMIPHGALANLLTWHTDTFALGQGDRVAQVAGIGFDAASWDIWSTLSTGATLCLPGKRATSHIVEVWQWMASARITVAFLTTPLVNLLFAGSRTSVPSLRLLLVGGDTLRVRPTPGDSFALVNAYGPTEATVVSTFATVTPGTAAAPLPPIGRPVTGATLAVVDKNWDRVTRGQAGELIIGGAGLARGYIGRPATTAERFVPDPFGSVPGGRAYRTGDIVRETASGDLEFLGREDEQVKIRGVRVEPQEIEFAIHEHPDVAACAVLAERDSAANAHLAAFVARGDRALEVPKLRRWLENRLPSALVPRVFVMLRELPLTASGKVDRDALRVLKRPAERARARGSDDMSPVTPTEVVLARLWSETLGRSAYRDDQFLDIGGDSLGAMRVCTRVAQECGVRLPIRALLERNTLAQVSEEIDRLRAYGSTVRAIGLRPREIVPRAAYSQDAVWFLHQLSTNLGAYNFQTTVRVRGALDVPALRRALEEIVRRHEILRTTFHEEGGQLRQHVEERGVVQCLFTDLTSESPPADSLAVGSCTVESPVVEARLRELREREFSAPLDLSVLPLIRWHLVKIARDVHELIHVEHHFVHDGASYVLFLRELDVLYQAFAAGGGSPLPPLPIQFADWATWQRDWMETEEARAQLDDWSAKLTPPIPALQLPTDRPRPQVFSFRGAQYRRRLRRELLERVRAHARSAGTTLYATTLAAFQAVMWKYSRQERFCVGISVANRAHAEVEPIIGMLVNMLPLLAGVRGCMSFAQLVADVHANLLEAHTHQEVPFERIVQQVQPQRQLQHNPLFQVTFNFHDTQMPASLLGDSSYAVHEAYNTGWTKFDLHVIAFPRTRRGRHDVVEDLELMWEYSTDLFDEPTIRRMWESYESLLERACEHPEFTLSALSIVEDEERRLLAEWNATSTSECIDRCVHDLIDAQVARSPDAIALEWNGGTTTYRELNERASHIADALRVRGVGPDVRVGVCVERGPDVIPCVLGVLKAGGCYVPLDPDYPSDRLRYMVEDSKAPIIVTRSHLAGRLDVPPRVLMLDVQALENAGVSSGLPATSTSPPSNASPENLAYIVYTSGSTGRPKGVMVPHRVLVNLIGWHLAEQRPAARTLQFSALSFDVSIYEIVAGLASGGRLVTIDIETQRSIPLLTACIRDARVEKIMFPASVLRYVAEELEDLGARLPALREVISTAERFVSTPALRQLAAAHPDCELHNQYGPSETHVATAYSLSAESASWPVEPPIGRPIANTQVWVTDPAMQLVPPMVSGELYIGGMALSRGYLQRPAATAERFVPDPFSGARGARLYRTGDRGRWRSDGELEFLGRLDDQLKVRGYRIEPAEIETVLAEHPAIAEVVVGVVDPNAAPGLVAYIVPSASAEMPNAHELRAYLRTRLPEPMIPSAFLVLGELPRTPSGKVDRKGVHAVPATAVRARRAARIAPSTATGLVVASMWTSLLTEAEVSLEDSFFDLGGNSLSLMRLVSRIRDVFDLQLSIGLVFARPTLREMEQMIAEALGPERSEAIAETYLEVAALTDLQVSERLVGGAQPENGA